MSLICHCGAATQVIETRTSGAGSVVRRRRICANGHRTLSREVMGRTRDEGAEIRAVIHALENLLRGKPK